TLRRFETASQRRLRGRFVEVGIRLRGTHSPAQFAELPEHAARTAAHVEQSETRLEPAAPRQPDEKVSDRIGTAADDCGVALAGEVHRPANPLLRSPRAPRISAGSTSPCWRQPFTSSQVRAGQPLARRAFPLKAESASIRRTTLPAMRCRGAPAARCRTAA